MSKKKTSGPEDPFASIPPRESFDAFPAMSAFPEQAIAFLTGKSPLPPEKDVANSATTKPAAPLADSAVATATPPRETAKPSPPKTDDASTAAPSRTKPASAKTTTKPAATKDPVRLETKPVSKPVNKPVDQPLSQSISQSVDHSASHSATLQASLQTSLSPSQSPSQSPDKKTGRSVSQSVSRSPRKPVSRSLPGARVLDKLNDNQRRVLDLLLETKPYIIRFRDIAAVLNMREASVRTILRRLATLSFLTFKRARDGNVQGVRVAFNVQLADQYKNERQAEQICTDALSHSPSQSPGLTNVIGLSHSPSQSPDQPLTKPDTKPLPLKIDRKEDLSISCFEDWDKEFLELMWPHVATAGFGLDQIRQAVAARDKLGKPLDRDCVAVSLDRAEWELETTGRIVDLASNEDVRSVPAYIFTALARWGVLRPHPDYVSREEREAEAAREELQRRKKAADALEQARFEAYVAGLSQTELEEAMRGFPGGSRDAWLKNHWRKHVRDASGGTNGLSSPS